MKIENLTISRQLSERLVFLGLKKSSVFNYFNAIDFELSEDKPTKSWQILTDEEPDAYLDNDVMPAWTCEELRIMIGWRFNGSEMRNHRPKQMPGEHLEFATYSLSKMKAYTSAAEANGEILESLLISGAVTPEEANERYEERFKP